MASNLFHQVNSNSGSYDSAHLEPDDNFNQCSQYISDGTYVDENMKAVFLILGVISIIASMFVTISIFKVPKLRAHPNIMIGWISLFEGIS
jgi:hypothetical protein